MLPVVALPTVRCAGRSCVARTFPLLLLAQKGVTISVLDSHTSALWGALNYLQGLPDHTH